MDTKKLGIINFDLEGKIYLVDEEGREGYNYRRYLRTE